MATEEQDLAVDDAVNAGKQLVLSPAYLWAAPEAKADIKEAQNMLLRLQASDPIITTSGQVSDWLAQVRVMMSSFLRERILPAGVGAEERAKLLLGADALKHKWSLVRAGCQCYDGELSHFRGVEAPHDKGDGERVVRHPEECSPECSHDFEEQCGWQGKGRAQEKDAEAQCGGGSGPDGYGYAWHVLKPGCLRSSCVKQRKK